MRKEKDIQASGNICRIWPQTVAARDKHCKTYLKQNQKKHFSTGKWEKVEEVHLLQSDILVLYGHQCFESQIISSHLFLERAMLSRSLQNSTMLGAERLLNWVYGLVPKNICYYFRVILVEKCNRIGFFHAFHLSRSSPYNVIMYTPHSSGVS